MLYQDIFFFNIFIKFFFIIMYIYIILYNHINYIRIGFYTYSLKGGGTERVTALFINYLWIEKNFKMFLFSQKGKEKNEYEIPKNIKRIAIKGNEEISTKKLKRQLTINKIDILIYQFPHGNEINVLNNMKNIKIIIYSHFCFLTWIYFYKIKYFNILYNSYKHSKYIVSLVPFENDYIFKKWGINSILMNNLISYEYDKITPSDLSSKIILMIGRASDKYKRFSLGIESMKFISQEIPDSEMKIISDLNGINELEELTKNLTIENNIHFIEYTSKPEEYYKNASLHIFPTISEAFPMILCETKIYGIPNILTGLDFVSMSKGGTIIIYDDKPESIAKEAIKILNDKNYRKKLGEEARESMKKYNNEQTIKKWIKLIFSVYYGDESYKNLRVQEQNLPENESLKIVNNQIELLKMREPYFKNLTIKTLLNFSSLEKILE